MNINCFQYNKIKDCKSYSIEGCMLIGFKKYTGHEVFIPITSKQKAQDENVLVYRGNIINVEKRQ